MTISINSTNVHAFGENNNVD